jgi:opacity protein-like surface antigen
VRLFVAAAALCVALVQTTALAAADPPAPHNWTGWHVGTNPGSSQVTATFDPYQLSIQQITNVILPSRGTVVVPGTTRTVAPGSITASGLMSGIQLGYTKQHGRFVWGIDGEYSTGSVTGSSVFTFSLPPTALQRSSDFSIGRSLQLTSSSSLRARLGVALSRDLLYATAGPVWLNATVSGTESMQSGSVLIPPGAGGCPGPNCAGNFLVNPYANTASQRVGSGRFLFGAGWEHSLSQHATLGIEYRRASLGTMSYTVGAANIVQTCSPVQPPPAPSPCVDAFVGAGGSVNAGNGSSLGTLAPTTAHLTTESILLNLRFRLR